VLSGHAITGAELSDAPAILSGKPAAVSGILQPLSDRLGGNGMVSSRELDPGASTLAFFGAELRQHRATAGMSQDDLGRAINFSGALVGRVEMAERMPSQDFADRCDEALNTGGFFGRFRNLVKREAFPSWFGPFVEYEERASKIFNWDNRVVPGLLQTEDYARAIVRAGQPREAPEVIERDVAARIDRQAILARQNPPLLWCVLDEAVLRRPVGGSDTMQEQVKRLVEVADSTSVVLQVLPFAVTEHHGADGALTILESDSEPPVAYAEGWHSGRMIESATEVADAVMAFDLIRASALPRGASLDLIRTIEYGP
jgi:transcriptional regulator with XRE-family HTH domain